MEQLIREMKRDIIHGYKYREIEKETNEELYVCETLMLDQGVVIYGYRTIDGIASGSLGDSISFLKTPISDLVGLCNAIYYNYMEDK